MLLEFSVLLELYSYVKDISKMCVFMLFNYFCTVGYIFMSQITPRQRFSRMGIIDILKNSSILSKGITSRLSYRST